MNEKQDLDSFEKKTYKEVSLWDWLGRVLPLSVLAVITVCYMFDLKDWLDIVVEVSVIIFFIICFIWWYWAIYKIAAMVKFLRQSQKNFGDLIVEFRKFKQDLRNNKSRNNNQ